MKVNYLPSRSKAAWQNNKPFLLFILSGLTILSVLKIIFYNYNYHFIFSASDEVNGWKDKLMLVKWSLWNDLFILLLVNIPLLILLQLARLVPGKIISRVILIAAVMVNSAVVLLNLSDIFYFRFHFQRASADLLYVLDHPFKELFHLNIFIIAAFFLAIGGIIFLTWKMHIQFFKAFTSGKRCGLVTLLVLVAIALLPFYKNSFEKALIPTFPLVELNSKQLLIVENSFHSFAYSILRKGQDIPIQNYLPVAECDSIFPIRKLIPANNNTGHKNIVLFIMESVPYDFFDTRSPFKVAMPFFDSLLEKSTFYNNAFCYAHLSNKGITAILAGMPTVSDIPLYHSQFVNMPLTHIGTALQKNNYHSFFCIGDDFDNFGFAKCVHWLGIENYYCREDIPGYKNLPAHTMGLQDEYVLDFMHKKINETAQPFFAINYNISTHYPYDLPASFTKKFPPGYTSPMKAMSYYDHSLGQFFSAAEKESWFKNTVFIFCSDHWMAPDDNRIKFNAISGYRIPIIIYDPAVNEKKSITQPVSQFDVMGTILSISGYKDSIISYGKVLPDDMNTGEIIFSRANASLYQVSDSAYVLGFNPVNNKAEFLYHYTTDNDLQQNLLGDNTVTGIRDKLTKKILAFLQKASMQYNGAQFK